MLAYSARNRSASIRMTAVSFRKHVVSKDVSPSRQLTVPGFAALLMAGLDGIKNKIIWRSHGQKPYDLPPEVKEIPQVAGSLEEALNQLDWTASS
ncbi:hypothetical protein ACLK19_26105 [Escherichia coli]